MRGMVTNYKYNSVHATSDTLDHLVRIHAPHSEEMISVSQLAQQELIQKPNHNIVLDALE